jgi:aminoglycoside phosphotransferase (APT) family kinase protein
VPREVPTDDPAPAAVERAVTPLVEAPVTDVAALSAGLNAVFRVETGDGPVACKAATFSTDAELLAEARLHRRVRATTPVPVPAVVGTARVRTAPTDVACLVTRFVEGRTVADARALSATERERLVAESARHLAAVHEVAVPPGFGPLRPGREGLRVADPAPWPALFDGLVADAAAGLRGAGYTTGDGRFADLAPRVEAALSGVDAAPDPAVLLTDYRPANLVFAPAAGTAPLVAGVLDLGAGPTGDRLLDAALAEHALVDVPFGPTDAADRLRRRFRRTYRGASTDDPTFDAPPYDRYRAYAVARRLGQVGYWSQFAPGTTDAVGERWAATLRERLSGPS